MSEIQRLLRVAARRNEAREYGSIRVRLLKKDIEQMRRRLLEDGVSANVLFEAVLRGYLHKHPAVLAMLDQWQRDEGKEPKPVKELKPREIDEIYAELGSGMMEEDGNRNCFSCGEPLGIAGCDICDDHTDYDVKI